MKLVAALASLFCTAAAATQASSPANQTHAVAARAASTWWYAGMDHSLSVNPNVDSTVVKTVQPGDDLAQAITSDGPNGGERNNMYGFNQPRVVYLAPGTYTLSSTLNILTDTIILGDASDPPVIAAAAGFNGQNLILGGQDGDGNGGELHFSVQIKNVILDTTANAGNGNFNALSWRVAQNAALENIVIRMPSGAHTGIWMGQGSTISVADVRFEKGNIGFHYGGHQQAQFKNMYFFQNTVGMQIDGGNLITIYSCTFDTVSQPIVYNGGSSFTSVIDSNVKKSGAFFTVSNGVYPNFMIENLESDSADAAVAVVGGNTVLPGATHVDTYVYGNTYGANPTYQTNTPQVKNTRPEILAPGGKYPVGVAPSYKDKTVDDVINVKDSAANGGETVKGDGSTDDSAALNNVLQTCATESKICFFPYGVYRLLDTLYVPPGSQIVGEGWSVLSGYGDAFADESNPKPIVMVGKDGEVGSAVLQDMRFSVGQALAGAILVQINMAGVDPTDVAIYNSLISIGGSRDTEINCGDESQCRSAYIGLHLAKSSRAYIDNFWSWVADHPSDESNIGTRSAAKGGMLVEATQGTWLVGVGSEHYWYYSLNLHEAENVLVTFFQAETNYNQGPGDGASSAVPPAPFTPVPGVDPDFSWCSDAQCFRGASQFINGGKNIYHYGAGSWNFFHGAQESMYVFKAFPENLHYYGATTHQTAYAIRLPDGTLFGADGGGDGFGGSWGALVAAYLDHAETTPADSPEPPTGPTKPPTTTTDAPTSAPSTPAPTGTTTPPSTTPEPTTTEAPVPTPTPSTCRLRSRSRTTSNLRRKHHRRGGRH